MIRNFFFASACGLAISLGSSCTNEKPAQTTTEQVNEISTENSKWPQAVTYEIFVQSFADADKDGIGDFKGMTEKLDYLKDLGIKAIWLMPIHPSPSYHKYDVTDYYGVHPDYGTMEEFKQFVQEAHKRDIRVVIDLVINHSAKDHPWFQEAMQNPKSQYRDYYVWAKKDSVANQIAKKTVTLDSDNITQWHDVPGDKESYYGFFWGGMPDLNFDNPAVKEEMFKIGRYWLTEVGVDGFRLDAARHIFPDERAEDNHQWWEEFRSEMEKAKPDVYLVGEVWSSMEEVAPYLTGLHALFNFDLGYAVMDAVKNEKTDSLVDKHIIIRDFYKKVTPDYIDATFITNHDQTRVMSELEGDENKAKMAASLLFTLPGSPYIYYGEEIGLQGKKPDPNIREPFLWDIKKKDAYRARWIMPEYAKEENTKPLSIQLQDSNSMYQHYQKLIHLRNINIALASGELKKAEIATSPEVVAFVRSHPEQELLVLHNLSSTNQEIVLSGNEASFNKMLASTKKGTTLNNQKITLNGYSTIVLTK